MKKKILVGFILICAFSISLTLLNSCDNSSSPEENQILTINNGFFSEIEAKNADKNTYVIELEYYVENGNCNIGGYGIKYDSSHSAQIDWYKMLTIKPGQLYYISDTMNVSFEIVKNPVVGMQGYKIGSSETVIALSAEYKLKHK